MKFTSRQLTLMEENGIKITIPNQPVLKKKYRDNHIHDYTDIDAIKYNVEKGTYESVCCWCSKPKWQREEKWRKIK